MINRIKNDGTYSKDSSKTQLTWLDYFEFKEGENMSSVVSLFKLYFKEMKTKLLRVNDEYKPAFKCILFQKFSLYYFYRIAQYSDMNTLVHIIIVSHLV